MKGIETIDVSLVLLEAFSEQSEINSKLKFSGLQLWVNINMLNIPEDVSSIRSETPGTLLLMTCLPLENQASNFKIVLSQKCLLFILIEHTQWFRGWWVNMHYSLYNVSQFYIHEVSIPTTLVIHVKNWLFTRKP